MSEALSLGAMANVSFDNVATAMAKLTLQGVSASEAGTGVARLFEEMSDSGSKVSEILQKETGKSFNELSAEGKDLYDILSVVQEYADKTGVSMTELFSSSNAGTSALQLLSTEGDTFKDILADIANSSGTLDENFAKISETSSFKLSQAFNELKTALIDIGGALAPIVSKIAEFISTFAKGIDSLAPGIKNFIGYLAGFATVLSPGLLVMSKFTGVIGKTYDFLTSRNLNKKLGLETMFDKGLDSIEGKLSKFKKNFTEGRLELKNIEIDTKNVDKFGGVEIPTKYKVTDIDRDDAEKVQKKFIKEVQDASKGNPIQLEWDIDAVNGKKATDEVTDATKKLTKQFSISTQGASKAGGVLSKLWGIMSAHPIATVVVAVTALAGAWMAYQKIQEKNSTKGIRAVEEATKNIEEHQKKIEELSNTKLSLEGYLDEYEKLSKKTNKTKEDQERMIAIAKELEKIDPSLVSYDSNGELQVDIDKVKELIKQTERLIEVENRRKNQDMKDKAYNAKQALTDEWNAKGGWGDQRDEIKQKSTNLNSTLTANWYSAETEEQRKKQMENWEKQIEMYHDLKEKEAQAITEYSTAKWETSDTIKESISNQLDLKGVFKDKTEEVKGYCDDFMNAVDFSDLDKSQIRSVSADLQEFFKTASDADIKKVKEIGDSVTTLTDQFMNGDISSEKYQEAINGYIDTLHELTGIDKETLRQMLQLPEVDATNLIKSTDDVLDAKAKISEALYDLANEDDMEIRMQMAMELQNDESIPQEIRNKIAEYTKDGKLTEKEIEAIIELLPKIEDSEFENTVNEELDKLSEEKEVTMEVALSYATKVKNGADFADYLNEITGDKEVSIDIQTAISTGDFDTFNEKIKKLPKEKKVGIISAMIHSGQYTPEQLEKIIGNLPKETQTLIKAEIENGNLPKEYEQYLDGLDGKTATTKVEIKGDNSDANSKIDETNQKKVNNKTATVKGDTTDANSKINEVNNKKIPQKTATVKGDNTDAKQKMQTVIDTKIQDKNFSVKATDNATGVLQTIKSWWDSITNKTVTITTKKVTTYSAPIKAGGIGYDNSVNEPRIATDVVANANLGSPRIATDLNNLANTTTTASQTISANMNNVVSAMAKTASNTIDTGLTRKALKYNVDLLTVLQGKIDKVTASISKLNAKQELAFGNSKAKLLKEEISLLEQQQNLTSANIKNMQGMAKKLKSSLKDMGFKIADDGSITNYNKKIVAMEETVANLKKKADKAEKTASKDKATPRQKQASKNATKLYNDAQAKLDKMKQYTDEYLDLTMNQIPNAQAEWYELKKAIASANAEMITAKKEAKTLSEDLRIDTSERYSDRRNTYASTDEAKADLTDDVSEKIRHLKNANKDYENELNRQAYLIEQYQSRMADNKSILKGYGFKFNGNDIESSAKTLKNLKKSMSPDEYEAIYAIWDEYMNDLTSNLPGAKQEIVNLNQSIKDNKEEMEELQKQLKELNEEAQDLQLTSAYDKLNAQLDLVEAKMEGAFGKNKIKYLEEQIAITKDLRKQAQKLQEESKGDMNDARASLKNYGIKFDTNNNMTNLQSIVSKTDDIAKKEAILELANAYEEARQGVRDYQLEAVELENQQRDLADAILEVQYELEQLADDAWIRELENSMQILQNELEIVQGLADLSGTNTFNNLEQQAKLYRKLISETGKDLKKYEKKAKEFGNELSDYGFKIEDDGTIDNLDTRLLKLKNSLSDTEFSHVEELLDNYFEYAIDKTHDAEKALIDYQKAIEDIEQQKLEATAEIEDKITEVIEKQVEDRIDAIEKERDTRIDALDEAQKAYDRWRDEAKYEDDYNEQLKKVQELEAEIEVAKRDTSLAGQKRLADLMEQLNDEQKNLEDLVEDKIDQDINNMFDDEKDRIEKTAEQEKNVLEEMFSDVNIANMVSDALKTGIFTDIEGNVMSLDTALMDFANNSAEYLGVMGDTLKTELLDNLNVALQTVQGLKEAMTTIDFNSVKYAGEGYASSNLQGNNTNNNISISIDYGDFIAEGGGTLDENAIRKVLDESSAQIKAEIETAILKNMK